MENEPIGTRRTGFYGPAKRSNKGMFILLALAAVAVLLYFGMGRKEVTQSGVNRPTPSSYGRRPVDDRTVRPDRTPAPVPNDNLAPLPEEAPVQPVPPADDQPAPAPNQPSKF